MSPKERIEAALQGLNEAISESGYETEDLPEEDLPKGAVELYRYPPDTLDYVICAVPENGILTSHPNRVPTS